MARPNRDFRRVLSKKSHSWWWDSHISPKNSKWLSENLEEMDQSVKQMLKLIEEDADSFAKKAEMYYKKRPELISYVEEFYRMYRALAERYDHVTGELRRNIPSELQTQGSGSDFGSEPSSPSPTPDRKPPRPKSTHRAAGFDAFLGSGASSDLSRKGSDGSSSSSDSGSDSDDVSSKNLLLGALVNGDDDDDDALHRRIFELENELKDVKEKLQAVQEGNSKTLVEAAENGSYNEYHLKISNLEQELLAGNEKLQISKEEITRLQAELELNFKERKSLEVELEVTRKEKEAQTAELELNCKERNSLEAELEVTCKEKETQMAELDLEKKRMLELQGWIVKLESDISDRDQKIKELQDGVANASGWAMKQQLLSAEITQLKAEKLELQSEIQLAKACGAESCKQVEDQNLELDALRLKYDKIVVEKDEISAKVQSLLADVSSRDERLQEMEGHLHRLHVEYADLITLMSKLRTRIRELEEEVARQRAVIFDHAEEKREVIRQLCLSIEHYRDGYQQLRQALHGHRRPATVMAS